jgi:hypothetical protein
MAAENKRYLFPILWSGIQSGIHTAAPVHWIDPFHQRASCTDMSLTADARTDLADPTAYSANFGSFRFIPKELATKCHKLIESYHALYGYTRLPDMLWRSDGRDIIECCIDLTQIFTRASRSRSVKQANDSFLQIATAIVSSEVLVRDLAGWGRRFPAARREAEKLFPDYPARQRIWLIDMYLYPSLGAQREFARGLTSSLIDEQDTARN